LDFHPNDKQFKIQFFSHLWSKKFQITFIISYSGRAFQQYQEHAQNSSIIFSFDLNDFSMKKLVNIQYLLGQNIMKAN